MESWPGPAGTSPKSITSWPFQRGQQDPALTSRSAPTFSGGVALILQEERGNKQEDSNSPSVHSFTPLCVCARAGGHVCASTAVSESKVSLGFSNQGPGGCTRATSWVAALGELHSDLCVRVHRTVTLQKHTQPSLQLYVQLVFVDIHTTGIYCLSGK